MARVGRARGLGQFLLGVLGAVALGYAWEGEPLPLLGVTLLTVVGYALMFRTRHELYGAWLTVLGFCAAVSRLDPNTSSQMLGAWRLPVIVGGSALATAWGLLIEERRQLRNLIP